MVAFLAHSAVLITGKFTGPNAVGLTPEDLKLAAEIHRLIAEGRIGKNTLRKVKAAFEQTADPVEMIAILRKEIASQYLLGAAPKADSKGVSAPRELILSSWLRTKPKSI